MGLPAEALSVHYLSYGVGLQKLFVRQN